VQLFGTITKNYLEIIEFISLSIDRGTALIFPVEKNERQIASYFVVEMRRRSPVLRII